MAHVRQTVRQEVVTALTGLATTGASVYLARVDALQGSELPALVVTPVSEDSEREAVTMGSTANARFYDIEVSARTKTGIDALDTICVEVETALFAAASGSSTIRDVWLAGSEFSFDGDTSSDLYEARMTWRVEYRVQEGAPETVA